MLATSSYGATCHFRSAGKRVEDLQGVNFAENEAWIPWKDGAVIHILIVSRLANFS